MRPKNIDQHLSPPTCGACADCGHEQIITPSDRELPCAPRCIVCGGPIQDTAILARRDVAPAVRDWRCPGCGVKLDAKMVGWAIPLHLETSPECAQIIYRMGQFVRYGLTYILPESVHVKRCDNNIRLFGANPEGVLIELGAWPAKTKAQRKASMAQAKKRECALNPITRAVERRKQCIQEHGDQVGA